MMEVPRQVSGTNKVSRGDEDVYLERAGPSSLFPLSAHPRVRHSVCTGGEQQDHTVPASTELTV